METAKQNSSEVAFTFWKWPLIIGSRLKSYLDGQATLFKILQLRLSINIYLNKRVGKLKGM